MKRLTGVVLGFFLFSSIVLFAQDAAEMDRLVNLADKPAVTVGEALEQVALLAGSGPVRARAALEFLAAKGVVPADISTEAVLSRGSLALMVMKAKGWSGGVMYSIFGGTRYAWRELVYRKIMPSGGSEYSTVSGGELLSVIGRAAGEVDLKME